MKQLQPRHLALFLALVFLLNQTNCQMIPALKSTPSQSPNELPSPVVAIPAASLPLTGGWRFSIDRDRAGEQGGWAEPAFDDSTWITLEIPHTWNVMPQYSHYDGLAWYRKVFTIPAEPAGAHLRLHFEAVFYLARVWLNGQYLGQHEGGYTPFEFDISAVARLGQQNILAIQVDNLRTSDRIPAVLRADWSFDWWNYGGIIRDVSVETTSRAYIARQRIVSIPRLTGMDEADSATVTAAITVHNTSSGILDGALQADLLEDVSGRSVLSAPILTRVNVSAGSSSDILMTATLTSPKLWHFDHPNLYRWSVSLLDADSRVLHLDEVTIGIRSVELRDGRFYLNGEPVRLVGITRHADYPGQGSAETVTAMLADYEDLKALNEVFSRPVHYPQADFILDYADRHGILLIPEVPAWQLTEQQMYDDHMRELEKSQLQEMIAANFNHASVWAWSIGNEIESDTVSGHEFVQEMIAYVKSLDPTRPVGFASNRLGARPWFDATALSDFVLMNQYFGTWAGPKQGLGPALDVIHQTWPDKTVIISEYGFEPNWNSLIGLSSSSLTPDQYYSVPDGNPYSESADVMRRQVISEQMAIFRSKPFVAGAIFWTYQDYRTPTDFVMGVVDAERNKRGSWEVLREEYSPALMDSVTLSREADGNRAATVVLHTRGPVDVEMPAYTLRGYSLHWELISPDGETKFSEGDASLPTLAPGATWSGGIEWAVPNEDYVLTVSIIRPTGFAILEHTYDSQGRLMP